MSESSDKNYSPPEHILSWVKESFNPRNDGWVQNHYREKLLLLRDYLNSMDNLKIHSKKNT